MHQWNCTGGETMSEFVINDYLLNQESRANAVTREELERLALDAVGPEDAYQLWDSIEETSDEDLLLLIEKNTSRNNDQ